MGFWLTAAINARPVINRQEKHTIPKQPERKKKRERKRKVCVCLCWVGQGYILGEGQRYWKNGKNEEEILIKVNNQYRLKYESYGFLHINQGVSLGHSLTCCQKHS